MQLYRKEKSRGRKVRREGGGRVAVGWSVGWKDGWMHSWRERERVQRGRMNRRDKTRLGISEGRVEGGRKEGFKGNWETGQRAHACCARKSSIHRFLVPKHPQAAGLLFWVTHVSVCTYVFIFN